jgi:hypothetical protein
MDCIKCGIVESCIAFACALHLHVGHYGMTEQRNGAECVSSGREGMESKQRNERSEIDAAGQRWHLGV